MDERGNMIRKGESAYVCMPTPAAIRAFGSEPMCLDEVWMKWADAWLNKKPFTTDRVGIGYMLAGDAAGASNIDPFATEPSADNDWVVEGPHVMVIVPDPAQLEGLPDRPTEDGAYVMWKGTPYAHLMAPVGQRPAQRTASQERRAPPRPARQRSGQLMPREKRGRAEFLVRRLLGAEPQIEILIDLKDWLDQTRP